MEEAVVTLGKAVHHLEESQRGRKPDGGGAPLGITSSCGATTNTSHLKQMDESIWDKRIALP